MDLQLCIFRQPCHESCHYGFDGNLHAFIRMWSGDKCQSDVILPIYFRVFINLFCMNPYEKSPSDVNVRKLGQVLSLFHYYLFSNTLFLCSFGSNHDIEINSYKNC